MDKFSVRWSLCHITVGFLMVAVTGVFAFWTISLCAGDVRLLTVEEKLFIVCGGAYNNPGKCNSPPAGDQCNKTDVNCFSESTYCQQVQEQGLVCQKKYLIKTLSVVLQVIIPASTALKRISLL